MTCGSAGSGGWPCVFAAGLSLQRPALHPSRLGSGARHVRNQRTHLTPRGLEPHEGALLHDLNQQAPAGQPGHGVGHGRHVGRGIHARCGPCGGPSIKYSNGFENSSNTSEDEAIFEVTRVAGTKAVPAASGKWYATAPTGGEVFTRQGGYSSTFPTRGYTTSVDIYLDVNKATGRSTSASTGARRSTSPTAPITVTSSSTSAATRTILASST